MDVISLFSKSRLKLSLGVTSQNNLCCVLLLVARNKGTLASSTKQINNFRKIFFSIAARTITALVQFLSLNWMSRMR